MVYLLAAIVILLAVFAEKISARLGLPALLLFMLIGMIFGSDGFLKIPFENYALCEQICSGALVFIMFYGGFNLNWKMAKSSAVQAVLLSTFGVLITTAISTFLIHLFLKMDFVSSFLISAVLGSTDAASVFSILRSRHLNLKDHTAPLLEMESGSNDPVSYMLTLIGIRLMQSGNAGHLVLEVFQQLSFGIGCGVVFFYLCRLLMKAAKLVNSDLAAIYILSMVLACYGLCSLLGGNAYLAVYLFGILLGNSDIPFKRKSIGFFDSLSTLAQIVIFFLLGLLSFPSQISNTIGSSLAIMLILLLAARPIAVFLILLPFKASLQKCLLVSFAGLRGAASCVFAIMAVAAGVHLDQNLFQIVFVVTLLSTSVQGGVLPWMAEKLNMLDENEDVSRTFNDYVKKSRLSMMRMFISEKSDWACKTIKDLHLPEDTLALMLERDGQKIICKGDTQILPGDSLILSGSPFWTDGSEDLEEVEIEASHDWTGKSLRELNLPETQLISMIIRDNESLIPDGNTRIHQNDLLVIYNAQKAPKQEKVN